VIKIQLEGIIQHAIHTVTQRKSEIKITINNELYSFKLTGGIDRFRNYLDTNQTIRLKGILDKESMEIKDPLDIWVKIK